MQIGQSLASYRNAVATLLTMAWPEGQDPVVNASAGVDNTRMLNHAYNAMLRAARDHGVEGDPMLKWVRKADGLLRQCYTGVYLESQADIAMARCKPAFLPDFDVSLLSFAAISAACRSALDTRVAINEGYCRRSKATAYQDAGPSSVCSIVKPVFNVTMQQIVEAIIVKMPNDDAWEVPTCLDALEPRLTEELCAADNLMAVEDSSSNSASAFNEIPSSRQQRPMQTSPSNNRTASDAPRKGSYKKIGAIEAARLQKEGCDVAGMFLYRVSESRASSDNGRTKTSWILTDANDRDLIDARFEVREVYPLKHRGPGLTF